MSLEEEKARIIDLKKILSIVMLRWYVIAASVLVAISFTYVKLRYTAPLYTASINVKIDDERGNQMSDLFRYGRTTGRIDNVLKTESEIIKSRSLSIKTLKAMNDYFTYSLKGKILGSKIYPNYMFSIERIFVDSSDFGRPFSFNFMSDKKVKLTYEKKTTEKSTSDTFSINHSLFKINVLNPVNLAEYYGIPILVTINDIFGKAIDCSGNVEVENVKGTSILTISYTSDVKDFATQFVSTLTKMYLQEIVNTKSMVAEQTISFIENQLNQLSIDVQKSQQDLAEFKSRNKGVTPDELGKTEFEKLTSLDAERGIAAIKRGLIEKAISDIQKAKNKPLEYVTFEIEGSVAIASLQSALNDAILQHASLMQRYNGQSKLLMENEKKVNELKAALVNTLNGQLTIVNERIRSIDDMLRISTVNLQGLPGKQQALINLQRNYNVNEKIFSYLLEKRLETMISKASIIPNASIIDIPLSAEKVFPNSRKNYLTNITIALIFSLVLISLSRIVYDKITDKETIETLSKIPVIGVIKKIDPVFGKNRDNIIQVFKSPKSIFSESIRGIRTNIDYLLGGKKNQIISLTSTVSGEGKTFCTLNLAASLTLLGNKVLIIGCDLRRPKIHLSFWNMDNRAGLTSYIYGKHTLEEIVKKTEYENLFVITSGPVPPNPSELLQSEKLIALLGKLRQQYDYIFLDTAPVGLVSDSFILLNMSDINIYILRAQYSKRDFAVIPDRLASDNNIKHLYTILNGFDVSGRFYSTIYRNEYGGNYGGGGYYYYGGYYGRSYGYYSKKQQSTYYSGYYSEDESNVQKKNIQYWVRRLFKSNKG